MNKRSSWTQLPLILTVEDMADIMTVKKTTIRRWVREGKLPSKKIGKQYLFDRDRIENIIKEGEL